MATSTDLDFGGLDIVCNNVKIGATKPGAAGTTLSGTELTYLDSVTPGTVTASKALVVDSSKDLASLNDLTVAGDLSVTAGGSITTSVSNTVVPVFLNQTQQAINANGAITLTEYFTALTSVTTTGQTFTLADSTITGQVKKIQLVADGADATLTFNTNATLVFADVGDVAELIWNGSDWIPIALYNAASGDVGPAYTPAS